MSLEAHHRFILDTMQRNQDIARNIINGLEAENARLKADVVELADALKLASEVGIKVADEVTRLQAEVEGLRASSFVTAVPVEQYERLRKAGDDFYESEIGYYGEQILENMKHHSGELCRNWNAAKEGKQP